MPCLPNDAPIPVPSYLASTLNLLDPRLGTSIQFSSDEWFATAENLLLPHEPQFDPDAFVPEGKLMDGWESRRRRGGGHDWLILKLGIPGSITAFEVDTAWFTGNYAPRISIQAADLSSLGSDGSWIHGGAERAANGGGVRGTCVSPEGIAQAEHQVNTAGLWVDLLPMTKLHSGAQDGTGRSR
jgi:allantoicase